MLWDQKVRYATLSDIGLRRRNNQDSFCVQMCSEQEIWDKFGHIFIVADGMGGHAVGELASKMAVDTIPLTFFKSRAELLPVALKEAVEHANGAIYKRGSENRDFNRMGTTCVVLVLSPKGALFAHVGDSRAYRVRADRIEQLTFDHSLQWELERQGRLKKNDVFLSEVKHVITRSLGPEPAVEVELDGPFPVLPNDRFLLCSDGLTGNISDAEIGMIVRELPPDEAARLLVNMANLRGGSDNTTVIIVQAGELTGCNPDEERPAPKRRSRGLSLLWFFLAFACVGGGAALYYEGFAALAFGAFVGGILLLVIALLSLRSKPEAPEDDEEDATVDHRPYRIASARPTKEFMSNLAQIELELRKMANEENWTIDWATHGKIIVAAKAALDRRVASLAMSELGKAIDLLMTGFHGHRKKLKHRREAGEAVDGDSSGG